MNLRTRLLAAAAAVTVLLTLVLGGLVVRQRAILTAQVDEQVQTVAGTVARSPVVAAAASTMLGRQAFDQRDNPPTGDIYLAAVDGDGGVTVITEPVTGPRFVPDLAEIGELAVPIPADGDFEVPNPTTVHSANGEGGARVIAFDLGEGRLLIVASTTARIDEATRQLVVASAVAILAVVATLALALWWVDRLGLQPISRLTQAAEDVADGRSDRRVEHPAVTTEAGRLGVAFNTMLDARQEAEARQRRFVADASHELRTPLTTLQGYAALHLSGGLTTPEAIDDAMTRIQTEAIRMTALVEDLLTLAALDEERPLDVSSVDLTQLLIDIGADAAAVQPDRAVDVDGVRPGLILAADQHLLTQAITAVTSNASRHTPPEAGLQLAARTSPEGRIVITIADRGQGIEPDQLPHLFDRFYKADPSRAVAGGTAPAGGRGLGLAIAKTVIEAHGGTIKAQSTIGQGTTITIELPTTPR
ncbi:MAG: HAMP domain-containing sensor histidine kinase [Actinomycetota bacterium]